MKRALILVDIQHDFLPGGPLAVPDGDAILPFIVALVRSGHAYELLVVTQDWLASTWTWVLCLGPCRSRTLYPG